MSLALLPLALVTWISQGSHLAPPCQLAREGHSLGLFDDSPAGRAVALRALQEHVRIISLPGGPDRIAQEYRRLVFELAAPVLEGAAVVLAGPEDAVIAFRGSRAPESAADTLLNALHDASALPVAYGGASPRGARVHGGFLRAWLELREPVLGIARALGPRRFHVTGHSLGGAVGQLCALELTALGVEVRWVGSGTPRTGNAAFVDWAERQLPGSFQVAVIGDPVPRLPPRPFQSPRRLLTLDPGGSPVVSPSARELDLGLHSIDVYRAAADAYCEKVVAASPTR